MSISSQYHQRMALRLVAAGAVGVAGGLGTGFFTQTSQRVCSQGCVSRCSAHTMLSYLFGTVIIAASINLIASLAR